MSNKLTLTIEASLIEKAKEYAHRHQKSLSELVANYFKTVMEEEPVKEEELTPLLKSMKGAFKLPADLDYKQALSDALAEKYL